MTRVDAGTRVHERIAAQTAPARGAPSAAVATMRDYIELTKPRLNSLVLVTTAVGYAMGVGPRPFDAPITAVHTLVGTALCAGAGSVLNQWFERDTDRLMARTANRPLPDRRLAPSAALLFGAVLAILGVAQLTWLAASPLAALIAFATLITYALVYTPMKRISSTATLIGAVPGALPPLIGWAAATGSLDARGFTLFLLMFVWQMPHFLAIAWFYRDEYALAGIPVMSVGDQTGARTGAAMLSWSMILLPTTLLPGMLGMVGPIYLLVALVLGIVQIVFAAQAALRRTDRAARRLFFFTIISLPILLGVMVVDAAILPRWLAS
ncbi:MAG: protoheme IX farnesyltransferase [Phycisphaerales bacterium]|nr:protoheme IX farnesyltransferase [Phycisphaerales bacterium]